MTPLAQLLIKETLLPQKQRRFNDLGKVLPQLEDFHCFECSAVVEAARTMGWNPKMPDDHNRHRMVEISKTTSFLPAPRTWIEWIDPLRKNRRRGALLVEALPYARVFLVEGEPIFGSAPLDLYLPLQDAPHEKGFLMGNFEGNAIFKQEAARVGSLLVLLLAMINTPRIIGRNQHMPHAGFERRLVREMGAGKFPLHAWTEILLKVKPPEISWEEHEAHLTGAKALHFCRAHLRIRLGRLELVSAHWRGDPALGVKQSKYKLTH